MPVAIATHLSIGSVYCWSLFNNPLATSQGIFAPASADWALSSVVPIFSATIGAAGLVAALSGSWAERVGPRTSTLLSALFWGGILPHLSDQLGLLTSALGVHLHSLPLVYVGFGLLGGVGVGLAYAPPVATLLKWFPDRKGLASGMAIMGFGGGALAATPLVKTVMELSFAAPTYLGPSLETVFRNGRLEDAATGLEVIRATAAEIAKLGYTGQFAEGFYLAGSGNNGGAAALLTLGLLYTSVLTAASLLYRVPHPGWMPSGFVAASPSAGPTSLALPPDKYVPTAEASRSPQFYQVWVALFLNATAGISVIGSAKNMMSDVFASSLPSVVDAAFCGAYVAALSAFNGIGRLGWAAASDRIGRKNTFSAFFLLGIPLYLSVPYAAHLLSADPGLAPLVLFTGSTLAMISMYGGGFAISPAYLADLFGSKDVGAIYGRLLTAWSAAGIAGPTLLARLRATSERSAIEELAGHVAPAQFEKTFGAPVSDLDVLLQSKSVTIDKLMSLVPPGTVDPAPFLYNNVMYSMAALLALGLLANFSVRPVSAARLRQLPAASPVPSVQSAAPTVT